MGILDIPGIKQILDIGNTLVDRLVPDKNKAAEWRAEAEKEVLAIDLAQFQALVDLAKGQQEIDKVEAASPNWFVAGWRPAVGWCGVGALILASWPKSIVLTAFWCAQAWHAFRAGTAALPPFPDLGAGDVLMLLGSMLGIGGMRTLEKVKGVATVAVGK